MKNQVILAISVVIGLLAFGISRYYLLHEIAEVQKERERLFRDAETVYVIVAARDIPSGRPIEKEDIGKKRVFKSAVPERAISPEDAHRLLGRRTVYNIKHLDPILWSDIEGGETVETGLSTTIPTGRRALSLPIGGTAAVSGMIQPNDRVDVLGTFTFPSKRVQGEMETVTLTLLQDVTVLAVGQTLARYRTPGSPALRAMPSYSSVTLDVTPREAELLVFAQQSRGSLVLTLRNPNDIYYEKDLPTVDFDHLQYKLQDLNEYRQRNIRHKKNF